MNQSLDSKIYRLRSCPFCGNFNLIIHQEPFYYSKRQEWVECEDCHACGPKCKMDWSHQAIEKWNGGVTP